MGKLFVRLYFWKKLISGLMVFIFAVGSVGTSYAQGLSLGSGAWVLPEPGTMVGLSQPFNPPVLKGIKVYTNNLFRFDFILDKGDSKQPDSQLKDESNKLIKYFLASLTVPEKDLWVNLSPYEKDRIVPEAFGQTEMGRDLLAEDYMLKQITASVIYPEGELGKKFWKEIYAKAQQKYGTTDIPVDSFNKVWIIPEKAVVYENIKAATAYVTEAKLKVMLESDYLALNKDAQAQRKDKPSETQELGKQIVREVVIPALEKEVNTGANFAQLRQIYHSMILAAWYKKKTKESLLSQAYVDRNKVAGVNIDDPQEAEKIWGQYVKAFKKGAFSYIKEEQDALTKETMPRKYFSGGCNLFVEAAMETNPLDNVVLPAAGDNSAIVQVRTDVPGADAANDVEDGPRFTPIPSNGKILAFGTSSTRGIVEREHSYPSILEGMIGQKVINAGVPAERIRNVGDRDETKEDGITRLPRLLEEHKPSLLILWHGRNDLIDKRANITRLDRQVAVEQDLKQMIKAAREHHCQVLLLGTANHLGEKDDLPVFEKVARDTGTPYLKNIEDGILNNPEFLFDRMHADSYGNLMIAKRIAEYLWQKGALNSNPDFSIEVPKSQKVVIQKFYPPVSEGNHEQRLEPNGMVYFDVGIGEEGIRPADIQVQIKLRYWDTGWSKEIVPAKMINDWHLGWYRFKAQIPKGANMYVIKVSYDGKAVNDPDKHWIWRESISVEHEMGQHLFQKLQPGKLILAFGSSSTAGFSNAPGFAYPDQLQNRIGTTYRVVNHGFSGERINSESAYASDSPGGLARWKKILNSYSPEVLKGSVAIIWHGRNDFFDNRESVDVGKALKEMVIDAQNKGMQPLIIGVARHDGVKDEDIYETVAHDTGAFYLPGIMQEIWGIPQFMMPDNVHTNMEGNSRIAEIIGQFLKDHGAVEHAMSVQRKSNQNGALNTNVVDNNSKGGIDLTPERMGLKTTGSGGDGIRFNIDSAQLERLQNAPGLTPVIINIQPMTDLRLFLGLKEENAALVAS